MKPPARAIVGHLIWSTDGGVWAVWRATPFAHAHSPLADKLAVHSRLRSLFVALPANSMLLSVTEALDPWDTVAHMAEGVDLDARPRWADVCGATAGWLETLALRRRRYYLAVELPNPRRAWNDALRRAANDISAAFGVPPGPIPAAELGRCRRQARELRVRLGSHVDLSPVSPGELCWLYARTLRREIDEPPFDQHWEPPGDPRSPARDEEAHRRRPRGVLAHLTEAVVREGGDGDDEDRPRHRRYVRIDGPQGSAYQTVVAFADMPHYFTFPGGGGEWLYYIDHVGFSVDWCVRVRSLSNADAQVRVRRKHRDLVGQVGEYDGEMSGAPPQLADAIRAIGDERAHLGANPAEPELQATILMSVAAPTLPELEEKVGALQSLFEPAEYGLGRPTGGQAALLRAMLPGSAVPAAARDYTQFMLGRDLAAGAPFCGPDVGDPTGLLLGVSLDTGGTMPVLIDPAYGPRVNTSPSLAAVGRLGSGKSFMLKRLCWDTVARGGQVVTIDRTRRGEYVALAGATPGQAQVVRLEAGADVSLDPLRSFTGDDRVTVTLGFLSLLAGCSAHSDEGAALADAVDTVAESPSAALADVIDELDRMAGEPDAGDSAARGLARRLTHYRRSSMGQLAFGSGRPVSLDADFIVFWAPNLVLPDRETLDSEQRSRMMLPEQVLGQALLYLVAAVGRQVVFRDPSRFAAALYDEAWALLASPYGQSLLIEGVRDGRKHNGAIWLASQHPNDFAVSELADLLGSRFVFRQARQAVPAALRFLGIDDSLDAAAVLEDMTSGQCLYRDVRDRVGLIQVLPPALSELEPVFDTTPTAQVAATGALVARAGEQAELDAGSVVELDRAEGEGEGEGTTIAPAVEPATPPVTAPAPAPAVEPGVVEARSRARRRRRTPVAEALAAERTSVGTSDA
ncbi:MAG TPA: ATP-binding protein [Acidimicrobiales bacterium]